jgi:hypothetical protein
MCRCDVCGKFRKRVDLVSMEETTSDGYQIDGWFECKFCCSESDYEQYFKKREEKEL